jgi:four helix bundle protein
MQRAAVSISSNLAEGCSRSAKVDYARFVEIATGSLFEVVSQATIGRNQGFLNQGEYQQVYAAAEKQSRMLSGLRKSLGVACLSRRSHSKAEPSTLNSHLSRRSHSKAEPSTTPKAWLLWPTDWLLAANLEREGARLVGDRGGWPYFWQKSR